MNIPTILMVAAPALLITAVWAAIEYLVSERYL